MLLCFLDTNVFLQCQTFDEIDWVALLSVEDVRLVVPKRVIQELDKHKHDPTSARRRNRARTVLKKLMDCVENKGGEVRPHVTLELDSSAPPSSWLEEHGYDPNDADDCIVGAVHFFQEENTNSQANVLLFADDYGARLKAKANNLPNMAPPDSIQLTDELDPFQKENQELQRKLQHLEHAQPKLALLFQLEDGRLSDKVDFRVDFSEVALSDDEIENQLGQKLEVLNYDGEVAYDPNTALNSFQSIASVVSGFVTYPSKEEVDKYRQALDAYVQNDYRNFLQEQTKYQSQLKRVVSVKLVLENTGSSPAQNIDVSVHFPNGFSLSNKPLSLPSEPKPPTKPRVTNRYEDMLLTQRMFDYPITSFPRPNLPSSVPSRPPMSIRKTNSYEIEWGIDTLKHNFNWQWSELFLLFSPIETASTGFEVDYQITADNLPDVVKGKLIITLQKL